MAADARAAVALQKKYPHTGMIREVESNRKKLGSIDVARGAILAIVVWPFARHSRA
jgi:hypothetical protein